jgi:pimeloyl-ACP methyl ester carboxylesterase
MTLKYDVAGTGPTLVLVHGVVHRRQAWDAALPLLTPYRRVVTVDLPGHGEAVTIRFGR